MIVPSSYSADKIINLLTIKRFLRSQMLYFISDCVGRAIIGFIIVVYFKMTIYLERLGHYTHCQ